MSKYRQHADIASIAPTRRERIANIALAVAIGVLLAWALFIGLST